MIGEDERHTHPARVDRCSLVWEEAEHHGGAGLKEAPDADSEYDPLVPSR